MIRGQQTDATAAEVALASIVRRCRSPGVYEGIKKCDAARLKSRGGKQS